MKIFQVTSFSQFPKLFAPSACPNLESSNFDLGTKKVSFPEPVLFLPSVRATSALEETKTGTPKSWFRLNYACVKLFTQLTKRHPNGILS